VPDYVLRSVTQPPWEVFVRPGHWRSSVRRGLSTGPLSHQDWSQDQEDHSGGNLQQDFRDDHCQGRRFALSPHPYGDEGGFFGELLLRYSG